MQQSGFGAALGDVDLQERAEKESQRLLEELKKEVRAEVREVGTLRKRLLVTVPAKVITSHLEHNFDEIRSDAVVPGFRKGHAPIRLIQKRYGSDVRDSLKTSILGQSFYAVMENEKLEALGDPLFEVKTDGQVKLVQLDEALPHLSLPESGDFVYACEVEIKPTFELPELSGIEIRVPEVTIGDKDVDELIERQRRIRGRYEPLPNGPADQPDDLVVADTTLTVDGQTVKSEENLQLGVRATRLDGIPLLTLDKVLAGVRPGETRRAECEIPDDYERPDLRGRKGAFEFKVHEVKRLAPLALEALVEQSGAESVAELRSALRDELELERERMTMAARKRAVLDYLLEHTRLDVPAGLSSRQTDRAVVRRVIELQKAGVPESDIEARIDELRTSAAHDVVRDLKLDFILEKVAGQLDLDVTDEEVNSEIARIARLYRRRFDRVRDDLHRRGLLPHLAEQIRHDKCVERLLADAKIVPVAAASSKAAAAEAPAKAPAAAPARAGDAPAEDAPEATEPVAAPKRRRSPRTSKKPSAE